MLGTPRGWGAKQQQCGWGHSPDLLPGVRVQSSSSATLIMVGQSHNLGPGGRVQSSSSSCPIDSRHYSALILEGWAQQWLGHLGAGPTATMAPAPRRRHNSGDSRQLHQLGLVLVKMFGVLSSKSFKHPWCEACWGSLALLYRWGEILPRGGPPGAKLLWTGGCGDTGKMLPMFFYVATFSFWAPQSFYWFFIVVQSF